METRLNQFVERMRAVAGNNLRAIVLYGSAVTEEFVAKHSDLNLMCILGQAGARELEQLHPVADWWVRQGNSAPVIFTMDELREATEVFSIELLDMKQRHRLLFGENFLEGLQVSMPLHRLQVKRELRTHWVRLRQSILLTSANRKTRLGLMLASVSGFCALFRHALIALGNRAPATKREAVSAVASLSGANGSAFDAILDLREGKRKEREISVDAALESYLEFVEVVTREICSRMA